nr:anti-repressor SinI family protein [Halalkalibacter alkaliphilus]
METLDQEWVTLLQEAKEIGLTPEEVKQFICKNSKLTNK